MADQVGRVLGGRYRLRALVGTGASAQVYLADDITLKRPVAVKVLHPSLADDPGFLKRFRAEAQAAAALNHPNIMAVYDWGEEEEPGTLGASRPYLVCEFLAGGSLRAMLDRGRLLSPSQALIVGLECARGLDYAHRRGFVHRDVKPANLLFGEDRRLRIADFGLARALAEAAWTEPAGVVMGTARYASPEQARGQAVDGRTDVYSLALVLTEAVTGKVPFAADTVTATLMNRLDKLLPVSAELGPLAPVVERAGRPDPEERFEAGELAKALVLTAERLPRPQPLPLVPTLPDTFGDPTMLGAVTPPGSLPAGVPAGTAAAPTGAAVGAAAAAASAAPAPAPAVSVAAGGVRIAASPVEAAGASPAPGAAAVGVLEPLDDEPRGRRWPWVVLAVLLLAGVAGGATWWFTQDRTPVFPVPNLVSLTEEQARNNVVDFGFVITTVTTRVDGTSVGEVVAQEPPAGAELRQGGPLVLTVSQGNTLAPVPSVVGLTETDADAALVAAGLAKGAVTPQVDEVQAAGVVLTQQFPPAVELERGTAVDLVVSSGPAPRPAPNVVGVTVEAATAAVAAVQLQLGAPTEEFSNDVKAGLVIRQDPAPDTPLPRDSGVVNVVVSKGPDLVTVPDVTGRTQDEAIQVLRNAGLREGDVSGRAGRRVAVTDPRAGQQVLRNSRVDLVLG